MNSSTAKEVLEFVFENDIKFIRLAFCDLFGRQKNIAIPSNALEAAFLNGVPFDAHAVRGFKGITDSDLLLFPDPATLAIMPWRPGPGRVARFYCDIKNPDGSVYENDSRSILRRVAARAADMGYGCKVGEECEFYLFRSDENGNITQNPFDMGGYLDMSPLDRGENIRREICLTLEEMGIYPEASYHEKGPGQNEIEFRYGNLLESADDLQTFKTVVKAIASRNGLFASFMPKPLADAVGSGLHVNLFLSQNGKNIFKHNASGEHSAAAESFIAGILKRVPEMTLFLNPLANSYERLGSFAAPKYVSWSHQNRSQLIRIPASGQDKIRMELRSPDPSVNPYLAYSLIVSAGLDGIKEQEQLPPPVNADLYAADKAVTAQLKPLPESLTEAVRAAEQSAFVKRVLGTEMAGRFVKAKRIEAEEFEKAADKSAFYRERYFPLI